MADAITEVWRVVGGMSALNGLYESEELARLQHTLNVKAGFEGATLERLPLATPQMIECVAAVQAFSAFADKLVQLQREPIDEGRRADLAEESAALDRRFLQAAEGLAQSAVTPPARWIYRSRAPEATMSEGVREPLFAWAVYDERGRVAGASLNGPGAAVHDMLLRGVTGETIAASEALFALCLRDKTATHYAWKGYTLDRLPLATPEMVAVTETAIQVDSYRAANRPTGLTFAQWWEETAVDYQKAHDAHVNAVRVLLAARAARPEARD